MKVKGSSSKPSASLISLDSFNLDSACMPKRGYEFLFLIMDESGLDPSITDWDILPNCFSGVLPGIMKLDETEFLAGLTGPGPFLLV